MRENYNKKMDAVDKKKLPEYKKIQERKKLATKDKDGPKIRDKDLKVPVSKRGEYAMSTNPKLGKREDKKTRAAADAQTSAEKADDAKGVKRQPRRL